MGSGEVGGSRGARRRNPADHPSLPPSPSLPLRRPGAQEARLPLPDQLRQDAARPGDHGGEKGERRETPNPHPRPRPKTTLTPTPTPQVNTFVKDASDPNPLIRALAVRTMGCIRVDKITEYLCDPLQRALKVGRGGVGGGWGETRASPHPSLPRPVTTLLPKQNTERRPSGAGDSTDR